MPRRLCLWTALLCSLPVLNAAEIPPELRVKPEPVFEFARAPEVSRDGDKVTVRFATLGYCDVTVAIENETGRILRHLASGVLGPHAPAPFQKDSKEQTVIWDGKDDQGRYIDEKDACVVRVSLGLKPRYEKSLFWEPKKRIARGGAGTLCTEDVIPIATPEGVYLFDGNGVDHLRLFDHEGNYVRTVYPFPAEQLEKVKGLKWQEYPHGYARPAKHGLNQTTLLTSGHVNTKSFQQSAAFTMAIHPAAKAGEPSRIALVKTSLNRLTTAGRTPGDLALDGPNTYVTLDGKAWDKDLHRDTRVCPMSSAFGPEGKKLYLAGYNSGNHAGWGNRWGKSWLDGVMVLDYEKNDAPQRFVGNFEHQGGITGGVACDAQGRVYVSNYIGNAVEIYTPEAKLVRKIEIARPTQVCIHPQSGELYVFSWYLGGTIWERHPELKKFHGKPMPKATLTILKSAQDPKVLAKYDLPFVKEVQWGLPLGGWGEVCHGSQVRATVDFWAQEPTIWFVAVAPKGISHRGSEGTFNWGSGWTVACPFLLRPKDGKLEIVRSFGKDAEKSVHRLRNNDGHQRLYVHPATGKLYVSENEYWVGGGNFHEILEIDPASGKVTPVELPLRWVEDLAFDLDGHAYLRQNNPHRVMRYDPKTWREIPWDYGEECSDWKKPILGALILPCTGSVCYSEGGMWVSPKGYLAVSCSTRGKSKEMLDLQQRHKEAIEGGKPYEPPIYPGRRNVSITGCVHVWDKRGKLVYEDAVPGMSQVDGVAIDRDDNIYVMSTCTRTWEGKRHFNGLTGTLVKVPAKQNKWLSDEPRAPLPLPKEMQPERAPDCYGGHMGNLWIEGAEWLYGGVGNCSFKIASGCICWQQSRFTQDYFARSFAPETDQFSVAVLDAAGNLILRVGQYGNVDDGVALSKDPRLISPVQRPLGGDEVALMHPSHVATYSDRYLYIGDVGNGRIVQVKLAYRHEARIPLTSVPDKSKP